MRSNEWLRTIAMVVLLVGIDAPAGAMNFDHLLLVKVRGSISVRQSVSLTTADAATTALDGTGCSIVGLPKYAMVPVTKTLDAGSPPPAHDVPSVDLTTAALDQIYVCYNVKCTERNTLTLTKDDQFARQTLVIGRSSRRLCLPAVTPPVVPCGSAAAPFCDGTCPSGEDCVAAGGTCACVPTPGCGRSGTQYPLCFSGGCPPDRVCTIGAGPGFCTCAPTCETSGAPTCGGICPAGSSCSNLGGGNCGCVGNTACGDRQAGQCTGGPCPTNQSCVTAGSGCECQ